MYKILPPTQSMIDNQLQVRFENGVPSTGQAAVKTISFSNVKLTASDEEMMDAGLAYTALTAETLSGVRMTDVYDLNQEE